MPPVIMKIKFVYVASGVWIGCITWVFLAVIQCWITIEGDFRAPAPIWITASVLILPIVSAYVGARMLVTFCSDGYNKSCRTMTVFVAFVPLICLFVFPLIIYSFLVFSRALLLARIFHGRGLRTMTVVG